MHSWPLSAADSAGEVGKGDGDGEEGFIRTKWSASEYLGRRNLGSGAFPSVESRLDGFIDKRVCQIPDTFLVRMLDGV